MAINKDNIFDGLRVGFCVCGSFCTFEKAFACASQLVQIGCEVTPIMSFNSSSINTRFGKAADNVEWLERICKRKAILTIEDAEPIGPKKMFDIIVVAPCTANTLAKLSLGITDTPVTMACKSHLRNSRPVLIAISTNDALSASAKNIGTLQNYKNYYFVPYSQDDYIKKPNSIVAHFELVPEAISHALDGIQIQPVLKK